MVFRVTIQTFPDMLTVENVLPSLGIRGKSRGSVRELGDSVECLEGCSDAKDARSGKEGRANRRVGMRQGTGHAVGARQARGRPAGRAGGARQAHGRRLSLFTQEHEMYSKA
ncbi:hypothetical protein CRG98_013914 [Punica granatum]|uniref:Uncharacterized protein n=1 Tax=Punica granatum TaxID=22663 RepID=A0A2I0KAY3_PUNGR|nr:hypothetical protein CRG98_013914 [Punica granatum]